MKLLRKSNGILVIIIMTFQFRSIHFGLFFFAHLRSTYIHYTNYRGLPVMGWNAGDTDGKIFNYERYNNMFRFISKQALGMDFM